MENIIVARLAVSAATYAIDKPYDYIVPGSLVSKVSPGVRVSIPFGRGNRRCEGVVLSVEKAAERTMLKSVESVLDETPIITREQIKLALWMHERFFCTVYEAFRAMLPAGLWFKDGRRKANDKMLLFACLAVSAEEAMDIAATKRMRSPKQADILELLAQIGEASVAELTYFTGAGRQTVNALEKQKIITIEEREVFRRPEYTPYDAQPITLSDEQQTAFEGLTELADRNTPNAALLYGVTGSGKTSVYIKLIEHVLESGKTAMVLVPEIALTPQLMNKFSSYFENDVAVLHSSLGVGERYDEWKRIKSGLVHVVIGTRSAVFAPLENIGVIILDEEQESTYKSESSPRYHARDIAKYRCARSNALLVLGSATPLVESMYKAKQGVYSLFTLKKRYNNHSLPGIITADMKRELKSGNGGDISGVLAGEIEENLRRGEQTILFLNRRGASSLIACAECGHTFTCPRCSVSMTYHSANHRLMCHYCGYSEPEPADCPECGGVLKYVGTGTQKVEEELNALFPEIEIVRMDTDTVSMVKSHEQLLAKFRDEKIPILLGTQMVAKGLDFENVTLVGVISVDKSLYINDYRARERTFSLVTQVVGRSGRGQKTGRAVIQTFTPENDVIIQASKQDYDSFYEEEIVLRRAMFSPPFSDHYVITCSGMNEAAVLRVCTSVKQALAHYLKEQDNIKLLGPAPAPITRVNNRFHYRVTLACKGDRKIREVIAHVIRQTSKDKTSRGVLIYADNDPIF